jgi:hypothetical protein
MREYITERVENTTRYFKFGNVEVREVDKMPEDINLQAVFKAVEKSLPSHYFQDLKGVVIKHLPEFDEKGINALYRDNTFFITNQQDNSKDLVDDLVHEFAHHMETLYPKNIYSDQALMREFRRKRFELKFELQSEGYWVDEYNFDNLRYDDKFDFFLYQRVGKNMLRMATASIFIRPYASVSLREYFATGFEAYYLGQQDTLEKISPILFDKIQELHHSTS